MHPLTIVLDAAPGVKLVGTNADVVDPDEPGHLLEAIDVPVEAWKEVPDTDRAAGLGNCPRVIGADLSPA
jgi:hypothetical protein